MTKQYPRYEAREVARNGERSWRRRALPLANGKVVNVLLKKLSEHVRQLDLTLEGGTAELFKFPTGAPFIGVEIR